MDDFFTTYIEKYVFDSIEIKKNEVYNNFNTSPILLNQIPCVVMISGRSGGLLPLTSAVINYRRFCAEVFNHYWGYLSIFHVFFGKNTCEKSNFLGVLASGL